MIQRFLVSLAVTSFVAASTFAATPQESKDPEVKAILSTIDSFVSAFAAGDADAAVKLFTEDAIVMPSNDKDLVGHPALLGYWAPGFVNNTIKLRLDVQHVEHDGNLAFAQMMTYADVTPKTGGESKQFVYRDLVILKKDAGRWRLYRDLSQAAPAKLLAP